MSELDSILQRSLDRLVPAPVAAPDWDDVLARASAAVPLRRNRRVWYALAAAVLLTAVVVNPAFGLGQRLLDFFVGSPAPEPVKRGLAELNEVNRGVVIDLLREREPGILAEQARGLMLVRTAVGPLQVWAAPTKTGGLCVFHTFEQVLDERPDGAIACNRPAQRVPFSPEVYARPVRGRQVVLVSGWARRQIASIEIRLSDGSSLPVSMSRRFYIAAFPADSEPVLAVARRADGTEFARVPIMLEAPDAVPLETLPAGPPSRTVIELETAQGVATLSAPPDQKGFRCWNVDASDTATGTCAEAGGPVMAQLDQAGSGANALVLLHGAVTPKVRSLELRYEDGAQVSIRLVEGFFLFEVPRDRWSAGRQPTLLVARDASGKVIAREPVVQGG